MCQCSEPLSLQGMNVLGMTQWSGFSGGKGVAMGLELRYHHIGIPTTIQRECEVYLEQFKMYAAGFETSPYGVEWLRFEADSPLPELIRTVPHVAFVVEDLEAALADKEVLIRPNSPSPGVTVAFIVDNGAPIELMQLEPQARISHQLPATAGDAPPSR